MNVASESPSKVFLQEDGQEESRTTPQMLLSHPTGSSALRAREVAGLAALPRALGFGVRLGSRAPRARHG